MADKVTHHDARATFIAARSCHDTEAENFNGTIVPERLWFALLARALWPIKSAAALEQYAGVPDRTARAYQRGDREPTASVLRDLLRSNEGYRVLSHIMRDRPPSWWVELERLKRNGERALDFARSIDLTT